MTHDVSRCTDGALRPSAAVAACVVADVWAVAAAGAGEVPEGAFSAASRVAMIAGLGASVPLDDVERVPDSASDARRRQPAGPAAPRSQPPPRSSSAGAAR